jgi:hypothetical protein
MSTTRVRSRTNRSQSESGTTVTQWANGTLGLTKTVTGLADYEYETMTDQVTPQFKRLSSEGHLIMNDLTHQREVMIGSLQPASGSAFWPYANQRLMMEGKFLTTPLVTTTSIGANIDTLSDDEISSFVQRIIDYAYSNVSISEAQLLVSLGELPQTIGWFASIVKRLITLSRHTKKKVLAGHNSLRYANKTLTSKAWKAAAKSSGRTMTRKQALRKISDSWLEYRFALMPLLRDIESIISALKSLDLNSTRFRARYEDILESSRTSNVWWDASHSQGNPWRSASALECTALDCQYRYTDSINVSAGVIYTIRPEAYLGALFGLDQPFGALWDLVPLSFMIDRLVSVNRMIASVTATSRAQILGSWVTKRRSTYVVASGQMKPSIYAHGAWQQHALPDTSYVASRGLFRKDRTVGVEPSVFPHLTNMVWNCAQWFDLFALFGNELSTLKRLNYRI